MATIMRVGGGGAGGGNCILVYVESGAVVTAVSESGKSYTATSVDGLATIKISEAGTFTVTANINGTTLTETIDVTDSFEITMGGIFGISRDITAQSPEWARTDNAVGMTATASVGTVAGASDFDNVYPWKGIQRETLSTGDVMVKIPKFYYARYREGNIEYIKITGEQKEGFTIHPAFNHAGVEADAIYVGAYKCGIDKTVSSNWKGTSKSGEAPMTGGSRVQFRLWSKAKGSGWGLIDISTLSAIQMLYLVEFANNNSQAMIGRGYVDGNSAKINTGSCDAVIGLTGRPAGTDGKTDIVYRGIEGIWGNVWEFVDGINPIADSSKTYIHYWICNDPSAYTDNVTTGYADSSYKGLTGWAGEYITTVGLDTNGNPHTMLPEGYGASETTKYCDSVWGGTGGCVYLHGGDAASASKCGMFCAYIIGSSAQNNTIGSRLIYIP